MFPSFLTQQPVYLPCFPVLVFCFASLFRFSTSSLALVAKLSHRYIYTSVPALVLPKRATLHPDPFVTTPNDHLSTHNTCLALRYDNAFLRTDCFCSGQHEANHRDRTGRMQEYGILPHFRTYYCLLFSLYHMFIIFVISY